MRGFLGIQDSLKRSKARRSEMSTDYLSEYRKLAAQVIKAFWHTTKYFDEHTTKRTREHAQAVDRMYQAQQFFNHFQDLHATEILREKPRWWKILCKKWKNK